MSPFERSVFLHTAGMAKNFTNDLLFSCENVSIFAIPSLLYDTASTCSLHNQHTTSILRILLHGSVPVVVSSQHKFSCAVPSCLGPQTPSHTRHKCTSVVPGVLHPHGAADSEPLPGTSGILYTCVFRRERRRMLKLHG